MKKYIYKDVLLERQFSFFEIKYPLRGFIDFNYCDLPVQIEWRVNDEGLYGNLISYYDLISYYPCIGYTSVQKVNGVITSGRILTIGFTKTPNDDENIPMITKDNLLKVLNE